MCAWKQILYLSAALYEPILCPTLLQNLLLPLGVRGRIARSPKRLCVSLSGIYHHFIQSSFFPPRPLLFTRSLTPVFATTLLTPDIVKTAHIPIQHNCTLLEGGARFFATDPVRLQAEIANVDLCCSLSTGVETPEGNWIEIMQYTGISIQLQAKN